MRLVIYRRDEGFERRLVCAGWVSAGRVEPNKHLTEFLPRLGGAMVKHRERGRSACL